MHKINLKIATATLLIAALLIMAAPFASAQATTPTPNTHAPPCITHNTGANAPPCWSNAPTATCTDTSYTSPCNMQGPCR